MDEVSAMSKIQTERGEMNPGRGEIKTIRRGKMVENCFLRSELYLFNALYYVPLD